MHIFNTWNTWPLSSWYDISTVSSPGRHVTAGPVSSPVGLPLQIVVEALSGAGDYVLRSTLAEDACWCGGRGSCAPGTDRYSTVQYSTVVEAGAWAGGRNDVTCNQFIIHRRCVDRCVCAEPYGGERCGYIDPCRPNPCGAMGKCVMMTSPGAAPYECRCREGYTGPACSTPPAVPVKGAESYAAALTSAT
jgi:hypothetical protein